MKSDGTCVTDRACVIGGHSMCCVICEHQDTCMDYCDECLWDAEVWEEKEEDA